MTNDNYERSAAAIPDDWCGTGTVLVADDDEFMLKLSGRMLGILGFTPLLVDDGNKALVAFIEHKDNVVCTILDMSMGGMSGAEAAVAIREESPEAKIIICSGLAEQRVYSEIDKLQHVAYLVKPFALEDLRRALHQVFA